MKVLTTFAICTFFITLVLSSCKSQGDGNVVEVPIVSLNPGKNDLSHKDVMEIIDWIEIKADSSFYIGNATKVEYFDSDYYILDTRNQKCVLRYTSDGTLVNRIGQFGDGPEEYSSIIDFSIDKSNDRIYILTRESTLYLYSTAGIFECKVKLAEDIISGLSSNQNGLMTTSGYSTLKLNTKGFLLTEFDHEFHQIGQWIPFSQQKRPSFGHPGADCIVTYGARTYCFDDINLELLAYDNKSNDVNILISFDLNNMMPEKLYSDNMRFLSEQLNYNWVKDFVIIGSNVIVGYIYGGEQSMTLLDMDGKVIISGKYHGQFPQCYPVDDNIVISPIPVDSYISYWENQSDIKKPTFQVTEDTNLLIMKWKVKSH